MKDEDVWLHALLESVRVGVHAVNDCGVTILYNQTAATLDGLSREEVLGRHVLDVYPSLTEETSSLLRVLRSGDPVLLRRQSYRNFRGDEVHTANATRAVYRDGRLYGALEIAQDITEVQHLAERVVELQAATRPPRSGERSAAVRYTLDDILTADPTLLEMKARAKRAARTSSPVLIYGPTGTGKELFAQGIHAASPRANGPFIAQNCAALPGPLLEGILFGTVKGSFTGAENRAGLFELASEGTLFLDEIHALPIDLQAKLLRVLDDQHVRRLGDQKSRAIDVRILAAMNVEPEAAVREKMLREDIFYRIQVVSLRLPALAQRRGDLELLIDHFVGDCNARFGMTVRGLTPGALRVLRDATWPGNVRELRHALESAMNLVEDAWIDVSHLPQYLTQHHAPRGGTDAPKGLQPVADRRQQGLADSVEALERDMIVHALATCEWNLSAAAAMLEIPRQTLQSKMKKWGISRNIAASGVRSAEVNKTTRTGQND
ncbi:sigma-54 interaction domain-containing protein [Ferroacidibacillus organovorans]|uniref:Sigma-54-dependent Fis family transcriptional regulator n=1 Tax=Ferroacidibacillus organovorans TaxID=1765683 RepID=A0A1V4EW03_9BACL|nr:sigma 54-interacting transcriptional regulator [Ferroacidibacillus organovorans]OPG16828.1 hypothetical protein B2M26_04275 [Ferroacidibacillus organovorans]